MDFNEPTLRLTRSPARLARLVAILLIVLVTMGCSEKRRTIDKIRQAYASGDYEETRVLCRHAMRKNINEPEIYYYDGLALLELGRDYESFRRFDEAVAGNETLRSEITAKVLEKGTSAFDQGDARRASDRLKYASDLSPDAELGIMKYLVADAYFNERGFERASELYSAALTERPDTSAAEKAYFNLAECYVATGDSTAAVDALDMLLDRFPKGKLSGRARFRLVNLLYDHARSEFKKENYETVVEEITVLLKRATNVTLIQRARFMLGEAYEHLEDYDSAYNQYRIIIDQDRGASGRIVERARDKINALRDSGLL